MAAGLLFRALVLVVLACGIPSAQAATLALTTSAPVGIDAALAVEAPGGTAILRGADVESEVVLEGAEGRLSLYTWTRRAFTQLGAPFPPDDMREEHHRVNGTVRIVAVREPMEVRVDAARGRLGLARAEGFTGEGRPTVLPRDFPAPGTGPAPSVSLGWRQGWPFLGDFGFETGVRERGFPQPAEPVLVGSGALRLHVFGGTVHFTDEQGRPQAVRLGNVTREQPTGTDAYETRTVTRLIFEGDVPSLRAPLADEWGLAAPAMTWAVDGTLRWTRATGEARAEGSTSAFRDVPVVADLRGMVVPDAPTLAALDDAYEADGEFRALLVGGASALPEARAGPPPLATSLTVAAVVAILLTKVGQALVAGAAASFYTRIAPGQALDHPVRARLVDAVAKEPGLYQRELQRRLDLAWGSFSFHLRVLERSGHLRVVTEAGYAMVFPAGARRGPLIPQPVARAVFDALPQDGGSLEVAELASRVGQSPNLVRYHLGKLEARGLVRSSEEAPGRKVFARASAAGAAAAAAPDEPSAHAS